MTKIHFRMDQVWSKTLGLPNQRILEFLKSILGSSGDIRGSSGDFLGYLWSIEGPPRVDLWSIDGRYMVDLGMLLGMYKLRGCSREHRRIMKL